VLICIKETQRDLLLYTQNPSFFGFVILIIVGSIENKGEIAAE
jgi:hypothetical protein